VLNDNEAPPIQYYCTNCQKSRKISKKQRVFRHKNRNHKLSIAFRRSRFAINTHLIANRGLPVANFSLTIAPHNHRKGHQILQSAIKINFSGHFLPNKCKSDLNYLQSDLNKSDFCRLKSKKRVADSHSATLKPQLF